MEQQHPNLSLSHSIHACHQLTALAHSNFAPAFALLPHAKRQAMEILYAYTRFTDDLADLPDLDPAADNTPEVSIQRKKQKLNQWGGAVEAVLGKIGDETSPQIDPNDESAFQEIARRFPGCGGLIFLPALKMIVNNYNIPRESLFPLIDGVKSDLNGKSFATFDDCMEYCHQVATSVGFASLAIWETTEPLFSEPVVKAAKACSIAFQWTNIMRDVREDYRNGRIYLPQSELQHFGLTEQQLGSIFEGAGITAQMETKFLNLMAFQLDRCEGYYKNSIPLYRLIHRDSRRTFGLMWNCYYALFQKICQSPLQITTEKRVRLSFCQKFRLWFRWHWMPCRTLR